MIIYNFLINGVAVSVTCLNGDTRSDAVCKAIATLVDLAEDLEAQEDIDLARKAPRISRWFSNQDQDDPRKH